MAKLFRCTILLALTVVSVSAITFPIAQQQDQQQQQQQQEWIVSDCPSSCECSYRFSDRFHSNLRTIDCTNVGLSAFPAKLPIDTQSLILRRNRIRRPFEGQQQIWLPDLLHLDLSNNHISVLGSDDRRLPFEGIYNLRVLDLSRNQLSNLVDNTFQGLFNLEELDLSENRIGHMADHAFRGLLKVETLKLSSNRLGYVHAIWWLHTRTLYDLELDGNYISVLQADSFKTLNNLLSLDVSRNRIFRLHDNAFAGLDRLEILNLQGNSLTSTNKPALISLRSTLKSINLGRNPLLAIVADDFADMDQLKDINLSGMPRLRLIEQSAFKNLPQLLIIEMHDNPYLAYVDAQAFVNTPQITHLLLHNNNMTVLERSAVESLKNLEEISFYGNPLMCDCNARWLRELLLDQQDNNKNGYTTRLAEADRLVCDGPAHHRFKLFAGLRSDDFGDRCLRMISNLFDDENERKIGDDITYRCRAVGVPTPRLYWIKKNKNEVDNLFDGNTLVVRRIKPEDAGLYECRAENGVELVSSTTSLNVANINIQLATLQVSSTTVTLTWNGTDRENHVFQILFRRSVDRRRQYAATVTPLMKAYTVYNLQPSTDYEACITLVDNDEVVVNISCARFTTTTTGHGIESAYRRIERTSNMAVGAALGIVACMLIVVCLAAVVFKRSRQININNPNHDTADHLESGCGGDHRRPLSIASSMIDDRQTGSSNNRLTFYSVDNLYSPLIFENNNSNNNRSQQQQQFKFEGHESTRSLLRVENEIIHA